MVASAIEHLPGDAEAALCVAQHVRALSAQAQLMGATSPSDHMAKAQAEVDRQAAYLRALEDETGHWELGPDPHECDLGGYGGHPDEAAYQAWIGTNPDDLTWRN
jgi:hypothetical protein